MATNDGINEKESKKQKYFRKLKEEKAHRFRTKTKDELNRATTRRKKWNQATVKYLKLYDEFFLLLFDFGQNEMEL